MRAHWPGTRDGFAVLARLTGLPRSKFRVWMQLGPGIHEDAGADG